MKQRPPKPLAADSLLWDTAKRVSEQRPNAERRAAASVGGTIAAGILALLAVASIFGAAFPMFLGHPNSGASNLLTAVAGAAFALAVVIYTRSTSDFGYAIVQEAVRRTFSVLRWFGFAITVVAILGSVVLLAFVVTAQLADPSGPLAAALVLAVIARVNWWFTRDTVPALLPIEPKTNGRYHAWRPAIRWVGTAAILFAGLGLITTLFHSQNVISAGVVVALALAMYAQLMSDSASISKAAHRLERALADSIVAINAYQLNNVPAERTELQRAFLELEAAASNGGVSRLFDKMNRVDPIHLMMIGYLGRELGELDMTFGRTRNQAITARLNDAGVNTPEDLSEHAIPYLVQLRRRIVNPTGN